MCSIIKRLWESRAAQSRRGRKGTVNYILNSKNLGLPKGRNPYGNGSGILVSSRDEGQKRKHGQFRSYSSKQNAVTDGKLSLDELLEYDENRKCTNAYNILKTAGMLKGSY